jgi:glycosyltransferase involved in cell wall biosynthesis
MENSTITSDNTVFIILSFEGPDSYSLAGGLGTRITYLSQALAGRGFPTHLFFIGDPKAREEESINNGRLTLHRWCQWISEYYPNGVYQGENDKVNDFNDSIPPFIIDRVAKPAISNDKLVVVLSEEWHTSEALCRISEHLKSQGMRDRVVTFWNANNTYGFDRIDWPRLVQNTAITTVSRYMRHIMLGMGINPLVIPNGIPEVLLGEVDDRASNQLRKRLNSELLLTKVARYDTTKGWNEAIEAIARLNQKGTKTVLLARGGIEPYGGEVLYNAGHLGLKVRNVTCTGNSLDDYLEAINGNDKAEVLNIEFQCPQELLRILYHASDAVLANSSHEPFGLVGLETMAAGGVAFTGGTGEDYAIHMHNAIVLKTSDPKEIEGYVTYLDDHEDKEEDIRKSARHTARGFTWGEVIRNLIEKTRNQASVQGILNRPSENSVSDSQAKELSETELINRTRLPVTVGLMK